MHDKQLYEYAVIRIVPKIEREEFVNVGIVMFCKKQRWIKSLAYVNAAKLRALCPDIDIDDIRLYLEAFEAIASGSKGSGIIGTFDAASRFRWLTAVRSSVLQTSRPHPGMCDDVEKRLRKLFEELVL